MNALALSTADLRIISGEPRVKDLRLGQVLGFARQRKVRTVIVRHQRELESYGGLAPQVGASISGKGRTMDNLEFHLNEEQALLVCMFARTNEAADVRRQIVKVFMAYRHGKLDTLMHPQPASNENGLWDEMTKRHEIALGATKFEALTKTMTFSRALTFMPPAWRGNRSRNCKPKFWGDIEVRIAVCELYREMTIDNAHMLLASKFGKHRAPSRSAIGRFWQWLDGVFEVRGLPSA